MSDQPFDPLDPRLRVGNWVDSAVGWFTDTFQPLLDFADTVLGGAYEGLNAALQAPPFLVVIVVLTVIAWLVRSWKFAIFTVLAFYLVAAMDKWGAAMQTLSLILLAAAIATILAIPIGIIA